MSKLLNQKKLNSLIDNTSRSISKRALKSNKNAKSTELALFNLLNKVAISNRSLELLSTTCVKNIMWILRARYKIKIENRRVNTLNSYYVVYELDFSNSANIAKCRAIYNNMRNKRLKAQANTNLEF